MLRCLDPSATYEYTLPDQDDVPADRRVRLVCRFLSMAAVIRLRAQRMSALNIDQEGKARPIPDPERLDRLLAAYRMVVVRVLNGPREDADVIAELGSWSQLWDWLHGLMSEQSVTEHELGKSQSRQHGGAARSAADADVAASA